MKPIPAEYRRFVADRTPDFARAVTGAREHGDSVAADLSQFPDNPFLLYAALWLADTEGVTVTVTPTPRPGRPGA